MQQMQDMFMSKFKKLKQKNKILFEQTQQSTKTPETHMLAITIDKVSESPINTSKG
jgi:hypothetical protein